MSDALCDMPNVITKQDLSTLSRSNSPLSLQTAFPNNDEVSSKIPSTIPRIRPGIVLTEYFLSLRKF